MTRLTNRDRQIIETAAVDHAFATRVAEMAARENSLAHEALEEHFTAPALKKMAELPQGWLGVRRHIYVQGRGLTHARLSLSSDASVPCSFNGRVVVSDTLADKIAILLAEAEELEAERRVLTRRVRATMARVTTLKALFAAWPEIEPLVSTEIKNRTANLPAIPIGELNKAIGLPITDGA